MFRKFADSIYLVIPAIGVLFIIGWHTYYGDLFPHNGERRVYYGNKTYHSKVEQAQRLISLTPEELEGMRIEGHKGLAKMMSPEEYALFPTADELAQEMAARYADPDHEALTSFIVGVHDLAIDEPHHAVRLFRSSVERQNTRAAQLALGYTLKILGEDLASFEVYAALRDVADAQNDPSLLERAYVLADPSTGRHNVMMGVGIIAGGILSLVMAFVMLTIWLRSIRRTRMGIKPNEWPSMRRAIYLKRMRAASDREGLDILEREVGEIVARRIDGFGDDPPPSLTVLREEATVAEVASHDAFLGEREYIAALFLDAIGSHAQAQSYYAHALRRNDLPTIHLAQGISLTYLGKHALARKAFAKAVERCAALGRPFPSAERAQAYLDKG